MSFKAVLFDLDGTLLDTIDDLADSMNRILTRHGFQPHNVESYKYFVGNGMINIVKSVLPEDRRDQATVAQCAAGMKEEYSKHWADKTHIYDGVPALLDGLSSRKIKMAILSNKPDSMVRIIVDRLLKAWSFDIVFGARETCPVKPDPTAVKEICGMLKLALSQVLYVGDTNTDMLTARAAGMFAVGVLWGFRTKKELIESGADEIISHPTELLKFFNE